MPLLPGDLKTHPRKDFWGCAVVLSAGGIDGSEPLCHIGTTPIVLQHDYSWPAIDVASLSILVFDRRIRVGVGQYGMRRETCIGIYTTRPHAALPVIGRVDIDRVYGEPLTFEVGDGTNGRYPLCGKIDMSLGREAVIAWLSTHDPAKLREERQASEATIQRLLEREAEKRRLQRKRKGGT